MNEESCAKKDREEDAMLYDFGKVSIMSRFSRFFIIFGTLLVSGLIICTLFAIMVRIGNLIIGW